MIHLLNHVMFCFKFGNTSFYQSTHPLQLAGELCRLMQCKAITVSIQQQAGE
jgi:hypothetical protein